jgi:anti-sigma B factor antagonist
MAPFSTRSESDVVVVAFENAAGLNDFRNTALREGLYELVQGPGEPRLVVDLEKVDYLSSSGVSILVGLKKRVETKGGKIVIFHVQPIVSDLLAVMKLDRFFVIADDEPKAIDSIRSVPPA